MLKRILVPLDGSIRAEQVLPVAARLARASGGAVVLLRVISTPFDFAWSSSSASSIETPGGTEGEHGRAMRYLTRIATSNLLDGIGVISEVVGGVAAEMILSVANVQHVDLIVMSSHGQTGVKRWLQGSVAHKVVRHSCIPVLLVHEEAEHARISYTLLSEEGRTVCVMVALDGSPLAEEVLPPAIALSEALSAPLPGALHLVKVLTLPAEGSQQIFISPVQSGMLFPVQVSPPPSEVPDEWRAAGREHAIEEANAYLQTVAQRLHAGEQAHPTLKVSTSVVVDPDVASALIEIAEGRTRPGAEEGKRVEAGEVIALATHGRSGLARWMMGSVTERVLGATSLPLLIVRPQQMRYEHEDLIRLTSQAMESAKA
ncbi:MAG TPA: universal stress protein [Ktedonobacteraceae bacterium]|nr:universal stress protein [Ktedonobacteraceae bacterium]